MAAPSWTAAASSRCGRSGSCSLAAPDDLLFRREAGRLLAMLTRMLGVDKLALAEDVVQDALLTAFQTWRLTGVPEHFAAWLTTAARNRAISLLRRQRTAQRLAPEVGRFLDEERTPPAASLEGDELRMMFSCCQPRLREEAQVALILHLLCGFSVGEVAAAFLVTEAAMHKRLSRGKKVLAESKRLFELTTADFAPRLSAVQRALYLLFNEGYHGAGPEVVRAELCREAMRLARLLLAHPPSATPASRALAALMCLDAARLPGRVDDAGNLTALSEQDRSRWDASLIAEGMELLEASAAGEEVTPYHLEAAIAAIHAAAGRAEDTRWGDIVDLYDALLRIRPSPVVALNRAISVAEHAGPERGLEALAAIDDRDRLAAYPFFTAAIGELELRSGRFDRAREHFRAAYGLARNEGERRFLERRIAECDRLARS
ncbi:MAG TPA: sigma-70 family RNA polymerase sigma factor [Haliangiales bacterium]|nr:sigma-70 family RNA polymerase sigma factor [Haliangiales bacterium]